MICLVGFVSGTIQSPGDVRTPLRIGVPVTLICTSFDLTRVSEVESKIAVQSASQACPTDRRGKWIPGTRWHSVAELGRVMGRLPQDMPRIVCLLAAVIRIPFGVSISFVNGVFSSARLMVQPVSAAMWALRAWKGLVARLAECLIREEGKMGLQYCFGLI